MNLWYYENEMIASGYSTICGVDEAGRGPLAGPVYAAAVILPAGIEIPELGDSKKLSEKTRGKLYDEIQSNALSFGIASADHREIDELNILQATFLAMNRAVDKLEIKPDMALIDGNRDPGIRFRSRCIVGGDGKSASIAAASILAKVSRDRHMAVMASKYPDYFFEKHKGYGTKLHYEMLERFGPSEIHRVTFLKKWNEEREKREDTSALQDTEQLKMPDYGRADMRKRGKWGESLALEYLKKKDYSLVAEGFRSRFGEIDLIVKDGEFIVFAEVKLRKSTRFAHAREYVGKEKQRKMKATANLWLASRKPKLQPRFDVIEIYAPEGEDTVSPEIIHIENAF